MERAEREYRKLIRRLGEETDEDREREELEREMGKINRRWR